METKKKLLSIFPNNLNIYFKVIIFSIFFFNLTMRQIVLSNIGIGFTFNLLYGALICFIVLKFYNRINKKYLYVLAGFWLLNIVNNLYYGFTLGYYANYFFVITLPLLMITVKLTRDEGKLIFLFLLKLLTYMIYFITIYGFIDMYTHYGLNNFLRQVVSHQELNNLMAGIASTYNFRIFTMFGHPLVMMEYYFIYFILNLIAERYYKIKINRLIVCGILFLAPMLTGSKLGFLISIFLLVFYLVQNKTIVYKLLNLCLLGASYFLIMQTAFYKRNLGRRFKKALDAGDITNGRWSSFSSLKDNIEDTGKVNTPSKGGATGEAVNNATTNVNNAANNATTNVNNAANNATTNVNNAANNSSVVSYPDFFFGKGVGYSRTISSMVGFANFELPILMFAYDYGILQTIMIYSFIYIVPAWIMFKSRNIYALFLFSIYFAFCNSFNGMLDSDLIARMTLIIVLILSLGKNESREFGILGARKNG